MELDKNLATAETYAREYISYLLAFFQKTPDHTGASLERPDNKVLLFGLVTAVIGSYLANRYVQLSRPTMGDLAESVITVCLFWATIALMLHLILKISNRQVVFANTLPAVLRVLPVSYLMGAYGAYCFHFAALLVAPERATAAGADITNIVVHLIVCISYFPRSIGAIPNVRRWEVVISSAILILTIFMVDAASFFLNRWTLSHPGGAAHV